MGDYMDVLFAPPCVLVPPERFFSSVHAFRAAMQKCRDAVNAATHECFVARVDEFHAFRLFGGMTVLQKDLLGSELARALSEWTRDAEWSRAAAAQILFGINSFFVGVRLSNKYYYIMGSFQPTDIADTVSAIIWKHIWYDGHFHEAGMLDDFARFMCEKCKRRDCHYRDIVGGDGGGGLDISGCTFGQRTVTAAACESDAEENNYEYALCGECV